MHFTANYKNTDPVKGQFLENKFKSSGFEDYYTLSDDKSKLIYQTTSETYSYGKIVSYIET